MIYFIGNSQFNIVKIGVTKNLTNRLYSYNTHFPFDLEVLLVIEEGNYKLEKFLHNKFKSSHLKNEWYNLSQDILNFILNPDYPLFSNDLDKVNNKVDLEQLTALYKEGKSNKEIATQMNISIHTVRRRIKENKLASLYRTYKYSKPKGYYKGQYQKRKTKT